MIDDLKKELLHRENKLAMYEEGLDGMYSFVVDGTTEIKRHIRHSINVLRKRMRDADNLQEQK